MSAVEPGSKTPSHARSHQQLLSFSTSCQRKEKYLKVPDPFFSEWSTRVKLRDSRSRTGAGIHLGLGPPGTGAAASLAFVDYAGFKGLPS